MEDNIVGNVNSLDGLRSRESTEKAFVRFVNRTHYLAEIMWIDFSGNSKRYQLLRPKSYIDIDTFKTHPWIAQDVLTKDRLLLDFKYVYMPLTTREHMRINNPNLVYPITPPERRKLVFITLPILSLRLRTLLYIRDLFHETDGIDELEIPTDLKEELKKVIRLRNRQQLVSAEPL